jgi:hypothetical protein
MDLIREIDLDLDLDFHLGFTVNRIKIQENTSIAHQSRHQRYHVKAKDSLG